MIEDTQGPYKISCTIGEIGESWEVLCSINQARCEKIQDSINCIGVPPVQASCLVVHSDLLSLGSLRGILAVK